ncbi:MAG TPA: GNAT family N-acetyltransferase [Candidatus Paceibacterota bacterium]|nr:GNAT family N-acetyltransferase [Candidatus Paceibacterota bacterium]
MHYEFKKLNIKITHATADDALGIQKVFYTTWLVTYPNKKIGITTKDIEVLFKDYTSPTKIARYSQELTQTPPNEQFLVAKVGDLVVGVCRTIIREKYNQLQAIYVLPEYQGKGVGTKLWDMAYTFFDTSKDTIVHVATYNIRAINFYRLLGFIDTGRRFTEERHRMPISNVLIPEMEMRFVKTNAM